MPASFFNLTKQDASLMIFKNFRSAEELNGSASNRFQFGWYTSTVHCTYDTCSLSNVLYRPTLPSLAYCSCLQLVQSVATTTSPQEDVYNIYLFNFNF
jgi:hypothetical protein